MTRRHRCALALAIFAAGCAVGPTYHRPPIVGMPAFKEAPPDGWKEAQPNEGIPRGRWWEIYNDPQLNDLESKVELSNQNVIAAMARYREAARSGADRACGAVSDGHGHTLDPPYARIEPLVARTADLQLEHHRPSGVGSQRQLRDAVRHLVSGGHLGKHSPQRDGERRHGTSVSRRPRERQAHVSGAARTDVLRASRSGCGRGSAAADT